MIPIKRMLPEIHLRHDKWTPESARPARKSVNVLVYPPSNPLWVGRRSDRIPSNSIVWTGVSSVKDFYSWHKLSDHKDSLYAAEPNYRGPLLSQGSRADGHKSKAGIWVFFFWSTRVALVVCAAFRERLLHAPSLPLSDLLICCYPAPFASSGFQWHL